MHIYNFASILHVFLSFFMKFYNLFLLGEIDGKLCVCASNGGHVGVVVRKQSEPEAVTFIT